MMREALYLPELAIPGDDVRLLGSQIRNTGAQEGMGWVGVPGVGREWVDFKATWAIRYTMGLPDHWAHPQDENLLRSSLVVVDTRMSANLRLQRLQGQILVAEAQIFY
jgi:hypothetical protein